MRAVFRRGRRHEAPPEQSSKGVEAQPHWLAEQTEPGRFHVVPEQALLPQDSLRGWAEQHLAPLIAEPVGASAGPVIVHTLA